MFANELPELCEKLLELYEDETYKTNFPGIQNVSPVRDPVIIEALNAKLLDAFASKGDGLALAVPDMVDYKSGLWVIFTGAGPSLIYDDVFIGRYYDYLDRNGVDVSSVTIETLKKHHIVPTDEEGDHGDERHTIYKSLIFDSALGSAGETYHLCEGNWYLVEKSFVERLSDYLDPLCAATVLPSYGHADEGAFNQSAPDASPDMICLDKTSIAPAGQKQVEPCDIYELRDRSAVLHHIKISTLSNQLSHLFNQGINALYLLRDDDTARANLKSLVTAKAPPARAAEFAAPIDADEFCVVYGIITHKDPAAKSLNLPLFSRISLMRVMKDFKRMGIPAVFGFVKDETVAKAGKKKHRKNKAKPVAANDGTGKAEAA